MFLSLISGSSGNSAVLEHNGTMILIDCGMSGKRLLNSLKDNGICINDIDAVLVTHEHIDHTMGVGVISRKFKIPVYATEKTHEAMNVGRINDDCIKVIDKNTDFEIGYVGIKPFSISHDAKDPVGFTLDLGNKKYSIATDTGIVTDEIMKAISDSEYVMLEANHDLEMLRCGEYPYSLKQRIMSNLGHLSNDMAAETIKKLLDKKVKHIMLSHLSDKNNLPEIAYKTVENSLKNEGIIIGKDINICVANRYEVTEFI